MSGGLRDLLLFWMQLLPCIGNSHTMPPLAHALDPFLLLQVRMLHGTCMSRPRPAMHQVPRVQPGENILGGPFTSVLFLVQNRRWRIRHVASRTKGSDGAGCASCARLWRWCTRSCSWYGSHDWIACGPTTNPRGRNANRHLRRPTHPSQPRQT